jgi:hypothetical protein
MSRKLNKANYATMAFLAVAAAATAASAAPGEERAADSQAVEQRPASTDTAPPESTPAKTQEAEKAAPEDREAQALVFPGGIRLGGLFDVAYERANRSGELGSGRNDFRSYHHFLFLSRQGNDMPVGFNAELLGLYFYELTTRLSPTGSRLRVSAHAGKIMVPFGPDPLFHKNYGGLSGADQRTLPVVWSSFGAGARMNAAWQRLSVSDEVYLVQGFDLPSRDQVLNLQRDLVAYDGARIGAGNRLALSMGVVTLWYSFYLNPMRFGRRLILQAVDLTVWRPDWFILNHFAVGVGAVRAHISNDESYGQPDAVAGAGAYFHFADYVWLRAYLRDWIYLQARSGLATFDNHTGYFYDANRATASDGSHHNLALVAEHAGAQVSLAYFWNFEKVDEVANDLLRLTVSYAF